MKPLPKHLEYAFLEKDSLLLVIISTLLKDNEKKRLVPVLKKNKEVFAWKTYDIPSISPSFCKHKINFEDDDKPIIQRQRRLNPNMKEVMKKEIIKLLNVGIIYPIEDSPWKGIVLGHKVSSAGLEVDKAKIDVIAKLPPPTNVKAVRSFLGHAGFYHRFIKKFSKIFRPMTKLLKKDAVFDFNKECIKAFESLKEKPTNTPIMVSPDWSQPFELMCDASDFAVGVVLGQREGKHFHPIHFASKTLINAQQNYTVTEKELLAVQDAKPRLIQWILLLQEFDIEIKNKKGAEYVTVDHLSRLENPNLEELKDEDIDDNFLDETLMNVSSNDEDEIPWTCDVESLSLDFKLLEIINLASSFDYLEDVDYLSSRRLCNLSFLDYLKLYFFEYEHVALNSTSHGLDVAAIGKPACLAALAVLITEASQSRQHGMSEPARRSLTD
ncbi:reverse transcriptase domain-containing protein [Tanacetum coccineum]